MAQKNFDNAYKDRKLVRFLDFSSVDGYTGLGIRQLLMESISQENDGLTYATINYKKPFISIGPSQDIDSVVDVIKCSELDVDIVRRSLASGGAVFYDGVMNEMLVARRDFFPTIDAVTEFCQKLFCYVSGTFGYPEIELAGNDMRWEGKKVGGFASMSTEANFIGLSFFNLRRPNIDLYMKIAKLPKEKFSDKIVKNMFQYIVTPEIIIGRPLLYEEVRDSFVKGVESILGVDLVQGNLNDDESEKLQDIISEMKSESVVFRYSSKRMLSSIPKEHICGVGNYKAKKLIQVNIVIDIGGFIRDIMITGDHMISPPSILDVMSSSILGMNANDEEAILVKLSDILCDPHIEQPEIGKLKPEDFLRAIILARDNCQRTCIQKR